MKKLFLENRWLRFGYYKPNAGFTLIELIVVIAILGILAAVLITTINPIDKISAGNDAAAIRTITQLGKANDTFAASNGNVYPIATTFAGVVTALNTAGEVKQSSITPPTNYTYTYLAPAGCTVAAGCTSYVYYTNLKSSKYSANPYWVYANGKACTATAATIAGPITSTYVCP